MPADDLQLAQRFVAMMREAGCSVPEGCATPALTYGMWIEAQEEREAAELVPVMIEAGKSGAEAAYRQLRQIRKVRQQLGDEAMAAVFPEAKKTP